jgi:cytochrome c5
MRNLFIAAATATLLVACARTTLPSATPVDAKRASVTWPGTTVAELNQGRQIYLSKCSSCHQPVQPGSIAPKEWPQHIDEMKTRSKLDDREVRLIERYLVTMSEQKRSARTAAR